MLSQWGQDNLQVESFNSVSTGLLFKFIVGTSDAKIHSVASQALLTRGTQEAFEYQNLLMQFWLKNADADHVKKTLSTNPATWVLLLTKALSDKRISWTYQLRASMLLSGMTVHDRQTAFIQIKNKILTEIKRRITSLGSREGMVDIQSGEAKGLTDLLEIFASQYSFETATDISVALRTMNSSSHNEASVQAAENILALLAPYCSMGEFQRIVEQLFYRVSSINTDENKKKNASLASLIKQLHPDRRSAIIDSRIAELENHTASPVFQITACVHLVNLADQCSPTQMGKIIDLYLNKYIDAAQTDENSTWKKREEYNVVNAMFSSLIVFARYCPPEKMDALISGLKRAFNPLAELYRGKMVPYILEALAPLCNAQQIEDLINFLMTCDNPIQKAHALSKLAPFASGTSIKSLKFLYVNSIINGEVHQDNMKYALDGLAGIYKHLTPTESEAMLEVLARQPEKWELFATSAQKTMAVLASKSSQPAVDRAIELIGPRLSLPSEDDASCAAAILYALIAFCTIHETYKLIKFVIPHLPYAHSNALNSLCSLINHVVELFSVTQKEVITAHLLQRLKTIPADSPENHSAIRAICKTLSVIALELYIESDSLAELFEGLCGALYHQDVQVRQAALESLGSLVIQLPSETLQKFLKLPQKLPNIHLFGSSTPIPRQRENLEVLSLQLIVTAVKEFKVDAQPENDQDDKCTIM